MDTFQNLLNALHATKDDLPQEVQVALRAFDRERRTPLQDFANLIGTAIAERDVTIEKLQGKLEDMKGKISRSKTAWAIPRKVLESTLPVPRLEIHLEDIGYGQWSWTYMLVHRLGGANELEGSVLGHTTSQAPHRKGLRYGDVLDIPIRDGQHIAFDSQRLGLPAFATFGEEAVKVPHLDPAHYAGLLARHLELGDTP